MALQNSFQSALATDSWIRLISEWAQTEREWLIVPRDPVNSDDAKRYSYRELYARSLAAGKAMRGAGARDGDRVVIALDNGPEFCFAFFGAIFAQLVPVPFPPPYALASADAYRERLQHVVSHCAARLVLSDEASLVSGQPELAKRIKTFDDLRAYPGSGCLPPPAQLSDLAMIQYTSGTTGRPRGVELSHGNLLHNVHGTLAAMGGLHPDEVTCGWVPMYHDMGLIATMLLGAYAGVSLVMLTPRDFIMRPESWLWSVSRYRAVSSAAPNFAYMLCSSRIREERLAGMDLGSWRLALNGSESVERATVAAFQQRFARYGFRSQTMTPGYGLAEDTVGCCLTKVGAEPEFEAVSRLKLQTHQVAERTALTDESVMRFVASVGEPLPGQQIRIADNSDKEVSDRVVGEIQVAGPCVMRGYHCDPEASRAACTTDGFLRTGDRGYIADGKLFVLGRTKDTIKRAGHLYDAIEIRAATRDVAEVKGLVASFGVANPKTGTEDLIVMVETKLTDADERNRLRATIAKAIRLRLGAQPDAVELVGPGMIPRTTSGKISNQVARERYVGRQIFS